MSNPDHLYLSRALQLAQMGLGHTHPNPLVGCVIVRDDRIIGEGYHHRYGGPHAEVEAVNSVKEPGLLRDSVVYVNLEPCSHFGKTPPCSELLIRHQVRKVVVSNVDPHPLVAGTGIQKLRQAGIEVSTGMMETDGYRLNRRFFVFHRYKRPYIILKWAQTYDGFLARTNGDSKWISGTRARQLVHKWRSEEAAILVGRGTALQDDPQLTVREWSGPNPVRIVLDPQAKLKEGLKLFDGQVQTLRFVTGPPSHPWDVEINGTDYPGAVLAELYHREVLSVLVEGGAVTLAGFLEAGLWDEARVFVSPVEFGEGIAAPSIGQEPVSSSQTGEDQLSVYENPNPA